MKTPQNAGSRSANHSGLTRKPAGMAAVAEVAGVSTGTVSNVLNYPDRVSERTKKLVQDAMQSVGFVRNSQAAALVSGRSDVVGFVLADLRNSLFSDMVEGAQAISENVGMKLLLANALADTAHQNDFITVFQEMHAAGLLLSPMAGTLEDLRRALALGRPIVLLNYRERDLSCCAVLTNNEAHGALAAAHLIEQGCRKLAYVAHSYEFQPVTDRWQGVSQVAAKHSNVSATQLDPGGHLFADGYELGRRLAEDPDNMPDGIVAVTDALGNGILEGLSDHSDINVPEALAVIGCEGDRNTERSRIGLSTIDHPGVEMGRQAMLRLHDEIENPVTHVHSTLILEPSLNVRESSRRR
ncbi:LacI family DNA-binding transcriptional regulator (plasmid) [Coraliomargarita sp. W4R53]